jgi:hypothetical protein
MHKGRHFEVGSPSRTDCPTLEQCPRPWLSTLHNKADCVCAAGHIKLDAASLGNLSLPIVLARGRRLTLRPHDDRLKVLDFGQAPYLLALEETASLNFSRLELQGGWSRQGN